MNADSLRVLLGWRNVRFVQAETGDARLIEDTNVADMLFTTQDGTRIPARYVAPKGPDSPAILYCHAHGNRFDIGVDELTEGRPALSGPYAGDLARLGCAVLCLEMPCFGSRTEPGEGALARQHHWRGTTLFGQMLAEQAAALDWLAAQPGIDATRIATLGASMGGTLAWWLAALGPRVAATVSICCLADLRRLVNSGAHALHGPWMTVPGLLDHAPTGRIAGLAAPRPALHCMGLRDPLTPCDAVDIALADLRAAYAGSDALELLLSPDTAHVETPPMRRAVLDFLHRRLGVADPLT